MALNPESVGTETDQKRLSWTSKDSLLYALGVGAGHEPYEELAFTTENSHGIKQHALPTMAVVLSGGMGKLMKALGPFDAARMLHVAEEVATPRPLEAEGTADFVARIAAIYDKGSAAVVVFEKRATDPDSGEMWFSGRTTILIRGEGGWGGERGPSVEDRAAHEGRPDYAVQYTTRPEQALLYRLSGDRNPLHSDPEFARKGGLERPILHGLCTYGFTGRALLETLCAKDPARFVGMNGRFLAPVFPGDPLRVDASRTSSTTAVFRTTGAADTVVLEGTFEFRD